MTTSQGNYNDLLLVYQKRLSILEVQSAKFGLYCPPYILMEIEYVKEQMEQIRNKIRVVKYQIDDINVIREQEAYKDGKELQHHNRAWHYYKLKDYDVAIIEFSLAIDINPKRQKYYIDRGITYHKRADRDGREQDYDSSISDLSQAIKMKKDHYALYWRALSYEDKFNYNNAISDLTEAIALYARDADYFRGRGEIYHKRADQGGLNSKDDYRRSIQDLTKSISINPSARAYFWLGWSYCDLNQYDKAIDNFSQAINLRTGEGEYYYARGLACKFSGQIRRARLDFQKAVDLDYAEAEQEL